MKILISLSISTVLLFLSPALRATDLEDQAEDPDAIGSSYSPAESAIEATIRDYIEGWYEGNVARMDRALHGDLVKRIPVSDETGQVELRVVSKKRMVELTRAGGGGTPGADYHIEVHNVYGRIATGLVRSAEYLDYVQLVETTSGWRIVNILFRAHD